MSSLGLKVMTEIDRQDNIAHLRRHVHTYTLNIHTEMYTGNYREVYQSAGISPCLNACEQVIPSLPPRLHREGTRITAAYFHYIFSFFSSHVPFPVPKLFCLPFYLVLIYLFACACVICIPRELCARFEPCLQFLVSDSSG